MADLKQYLNRTTLLDGGWGTQLQKLGLQPGESCERWNLEHPEHVLTVAGAYVQAGSDIILTNTFQGNSFTLANHDLADKVTQINRRGVEISQEACAKFGGKTKVFASIGPSGKMVMMGDVSEEEVVEAFSQQVRGMLEGKPDGFVAETFTDLEELKLVAKAVRSVCDLPLVGSMTFDSGPDKMRTMMGTSIEQLVEAAGEVGLSAVGANCGVGIENYLRVAKCFREQTKLPVWIKANAGLPEQVGSEVRYKQTPAEFAEHAKSLIDLGVNFLGGCCGTTPEHIRLLRATIDQHK
jgi:methionine synthase I (cobalamin-dependent)